MTSPPSTRREFLAAASAAAAMLPAPARARQPGAPRWAIGCHTRPFASFRASQAGNADYVLDAVKAAGFEFADMIAPGGVGVRNAVPGAAPGGAAGSAPEGRGVSESDAIAALKQDGRSTTSIKAMAALRTGTSTCCAPMTQTASSQRIRLIRVGS